MLTVHQHDGGTLTLCLNLRMMRSHDPAARDSRESPSERGVNSVVVVQEQKYHTSLTRLGPIDATVTVMIA